jgi:hypothetical protein
MADRKISELSEAASVASGDYIVVVTGVAAGGSALTTNKFAMSGLMNDVVNIDEVIIAGTGIVLDSTVNVGAPNTVEINVDGYSLLGHTHTASDITDFSTAVADEIQQIIKLQNSDLVNTGSSLVESTDLSISLEANSKYLCELGTIIVNNENTSIVSGLVNVTGTMAVNYPTKLYGTWNHLDIDNQGQANLHGSLSSVTGYGLLVDELDTSANGQEMTILNKFTVETTNNEADTISFGFVTNSTNPATSGVLKKGSWLKAEKII